ncbi:protein LITTLE ZIPPER 2-like [Humulus lupulus]|uniref:protein LITTLE ZIPPER 2-like n=1 Tax=Humulus lupulus TaxID=3486 RepID=UPI002B4132F3|nr:protein LITTLE ZIPPER 2-like [Humulus lupulus]
MCMNSSELITGTAITSIYASFRLRRSSSKRFNLRVHGLNRRRKSDMVGVKVEMEIKNLKLYMENQTIMEENQKLRKKALLLHQENQALLSQIQNKLSSQLGN